MAMDRYNDCIMLITRSESLTQSLAAVINGALPSIQDLPKSALLKAIVVDGEFATIDSIQYIRENYPTAFIGVFDVRGADNPLLRVYLIKHGGANMVAHDVQVSWRS